MNEKIGFIGVGRMGANMARRLHEQHFSVTGIYDTNREAARALAPELGAKTCETLTEVAASAEGVFKKSAVFQRAILAKPAKPSDTALLYFRGYPGIARIQAVADKDRNLQPFMRKNQQLFADEGIALVVMDCPTDQWGSAGGPRVTGCRDDYRSSKQHADDVRSVIAKLRNEYGYSRIFVMGHSMGTISSRWLAKNLGNEITGSIHSSSMNGFNKFGYANSLSDFP